MMPGGHMTENERKIAELENRVIAADVKNDPATFEELLADDAILTSQDGGIFNKAFVISMHQPPGAAKFSRYEMSEMIIKVYGMSAITNCRVDLTHNGVDAAIRFSRTWVFHNGRWQIVAGHNSMIPL
jgi:hypothetical protein